MNPSLRAPILWLALASSACGATAAPPPAPAPAAASSTCKPNPDPPWSYESGREAPGPERWGTIPAYAVCSNGTNQSPINLRAVGAGGSSTRSPSAEPAPVLDFGKAPVRAWVNNGHTLETRFAAGATLRLGTTTYTLVNVHFHVPAEHLVGDKQYAMEMHAVTLDDPSTPKAAKVFGVFFDLDDRGRQPLLDAMLEHFARNEHDHEICSQEARDTTLDLGPLLPAGSALWAYDGSLTTPPCREIVTFYMAQRPLTISRSELDSFTERVGLRSTARPVQRRNERVVRAISAPIVRVGG